MDVSKEGVVFDIYLAEAGVGAEVEGGELILLKPKEVEGAEGAKAEGAELISAQVEGVKTVEVGDVDGLDVVAGKVDVREIDRQLLLCDGALDLVVLELKYLEVPALPHPEWYLLDVSPVGRYLLEVGQVKVLMLFVLHGQALLLWPLSQHQQSAYLVDHLPLLFVRLQDLGLVLDSLDDVLLLTPFLELLDEGG